MRIYFAGPLFTPYERGYIDDCTALLRADGFEVFVPHEHELALGDDVTAETIFARDRVGIRGANAMLAILDGPAIDDGTACEIGMFHALMRSDPEKRGIVGLLTDLRGLRGESTGVNLFVQGVIEDAGGIVDSLEAAQQMLRRWRWAGRSHQGKNGRRSAVDPDGHAASRCNRSSSSRSPSSCRTIAMATSESPPVPGIAGRTLDVAFRERFMVPSASAD